MGIRSEDPDGWNRRFDEPIVLPDGTKLTTLREAIQHLARTVPKAEQDRFEVGVAAETLTHAAERGPAWMFLARIAVLRALHRNDPPPPFSDRKDTHWGKRKLKRDE